MGGNKPFSTMGLVPPSPLLLEGSNIPLSIWLHLMFLWAMQILGSKIA